MSWSNPPPMPVTEPKSESDFESDTLLLNPVDYDRVMAHMKKLIDCLSNKGYDAAGLVAYYSSFAANVEVDREVPIRYLRVRSHVSPGLHEMRLTDFFVSLENVERLDEDIWNLIQMIMDSYHAMQRAPK